MAAILRDRKISVRRALLEQLVRLADVLMLPFTLIAVPAVLFLARVGWRAPLCRALFEKIHATVVRHHYYTPILYPSDLTGDLLAVRELPGIDVRPAAQRELLEAMDYVQEIEPNSGPAFDYDNPNFSRNDTVILYGMIRHYKPKRVIEVGSGYSTLVMSAALKRNDNGASHSCIEPFEMPWLEKTGVTVIRERVEKMDLAPFRALEAGDVLFIDSSHVIRPQGDVTHLFLTILPQLAPGVIVHVHDIYTPHDYHPYLVVQERKMWDEQYLLEGLLSGGRDFEVLLGVFWASHALPDAFNHAVPGYRDVPVRNGCSFWMRRSGAPDFWA